ncbi:uncharacterized protein LOC116852457 [Odontomachus brunneus]|uniref:uncharacterized protein LOC116852457 n=1 Tax=Odontomachus brunneus TaxID=486640 RepID=UPI0013F1C306|nr:uncharacterized protein LOC116852457 [Odontomachus brunneus]
MQNFEEHRSAQQAIDKRKNSVTTNNVKSPLKGSTNMTWTITENFVKIQEEIRVKLEHMEVKLDRILNKLFSEEIKLNTSHGIPAFPLRTEEEWEQMEEILTDDNAFIYVMY